jgi:hypothetical protein
MNANIAKPKHSYVLITGAAGGLGKAFAIECASRGWDLYLTDLRPEPLETLARSLRSTYDVRVEIVPADLTDPLSRSDLVDTLDERFVHLWMLINVAGTDFEGPFFEQSREQIRTIIRLNVEGTLDMTRTMLAYRDPLTTFRIINVASLAAFYPMPIKATYAASKRFLLDFSQALGAELRSLGVTVTALCPAGMPTTAGCIQAIDAQGLAGQLTTMDVGAVANQTLNAALRGKSVVIPGGINRAVQVIGSLIPRPLLVRMIGSRWQSARAKQNLSLPLVGQV